MELLIPGLILVALMAWVSTRIKKRAADAFEAEPIETDHYRLVKPEGFLHLIGSSDHEFYAYSREFGEDDSAKVRRATIAIDAFPGREIEDVFAESVRSAAKTKANEDAAASELETEELTDGITVCAFYKIGASNNTVYRLRIAVLPEHRDDYLRKIEETLDSFHTK